MSTADGFTDCALPVSVRIDLAAPDWETMARRLATIAEAVRHFTGTDVVRSVYSDDVYMPVPPVPPLPKVS